VTDVHERVGPTTGRTCRSIVSGVTALAVRHRAVPANPTGSLSGCRRGRRVCLVRCPRRSTLDRFGLWWLIRWQYGRACSTCRRFCWRRVTGSGRRWQLWRDVDLDLGVLRVTSTLIRVGWRKATRRAPALTPARTAPPSPAGTSDTPQKCNDVETPANGVPRHHRELARGLEPLTCCFSLGGVGGLASSGVWPGETSH
jgi:hypothetical protein